MDPVQRGSHVEQTADVGRRHVTGFGGRVARSRDLVGVVPDGPQGARNAAERLGVSNSVQ